MRKRRGGPSSSWCRRTTREAFFACAAPDGNPLNAVCAFHTAPGVRCANPATTLDHLVPRGQGGGHGVGNIVAACHACNSEKRDLSLVAFLRARGFARSDLAREVRRLRQIADRDIEPHRRRLAYARKLDRRVAERIEEEIRAGRLVRVRGGDFTDETPIDSDDAVDPIPF